MFWLPDYDFDKSNPLQPILILGVVARLVAKNLANHPLFRDCMKALPKQAPVMSVHYDHPLGTDYHANHFYRMLHKAYPTEYPNDNDGGRSWLSGYVDYCHRKTCMKQDSWLGGCIGEQAYETLSKHNELVPYSLLDCKGLHCWFVPLREVTHTPYVSVRKSRSHTTKAEVSVAMAEFIERCRRNLPAYLLDLQGQGRFQEALQNCIERLEGERLRYWGTQGSSADCDHHLSKWDKSFAIAAWAFGKADNVYQQYDRYHWSLDNDKYRMFLDSNPTDETWFPSVFPKPF
jgi:hypothetical protein